MVCYISVTTYRFQTMSIDEQESGQTIESRESFNCGERDESCERRMQKKKREEERRGKGKNMRLADGGKKFGRQRKNAGGGVPEQQQFPGSRSSDWPGATAGQILPTLR